MSRPNPIVPRWPSTGPDSGREGYARHRRWVTGAFGLVGLVLLLAVGNPGLAEATLLVTTIGMLLVAVAATVAICRRRVRRMDEAFDADESRWFGINAHRRVRITVYAVLLTVGLHVVLQAWNARLLETERVEGAEIIDLAAAQRMYSQRIGRLASMLLSREGGFDATRDELANALAGSNDAAIRLEGLLRRKGVFDQPDATQLNTAFATWHDARSTLVTTASDLYEYLDAVEGAVDPRVLGALVDMTQERADPALDAAQALVDALMLRARVRQFEAAAQGRAASLLTLLVLLVVALFVAEPVVRTMKRQQRRFFRQLEEVRRLALVAERTTNIVMITDARRHIVWINDAFRRVTGHDPGSALGSDPAELLLDRGGDPRTFSRVRDALARGEGVRTLLPLRTSAAAELWLDVDIQPLRDDGGALAGFVCVASDATDRRRAQAELRIAAIAFESLEGIAITDAQQRILKVNGAFTRITGFEPHEAIGRKPGRLLRSGRQGPDFYAEMAATLRAKRHWQGEVWNRARDGRLFLTRLSITALANDEDEVENYIGMFTDITQKRRADETIYHLAYYDPLTDLPNRRLLFERLQEAMKSSELTGRFGAVMFIDLDHFKELNDTRGHEVGDQLLVEVARRLKSAVRHGDTVARQGGDEFVVVVCGLNSVAEKATAEAEAIGEGIRMALQRAYLLQGREYHSTPSIGICLFAGRELGMDELLKRADVAMYQAKHSGRNAISFFDPHTHAAMSDRIALEADLRHAVSGGQLRLHFQPQVDPSCRVVGAEVLLRWLHPKRGLVPPDQFIAVAEQSELILDMGAWVLRHACAQLAAWADVPERRHLQLAVNVSPRQFRRPDFVDQVRQAVDHAGCDPEKLKLELTESLVVLNVDDTVAKMNELRRLGVRFSLDDFGTGHSSFAYLTRLPLEEIKIDRSFIRNMTVNHSDAVVVQAIIGMSRNLSIEVIAEGVETREQRDFLEANGCRRYQGYLFGRPMEIAEFERTFLHPSCCEAASAAGPVAADAVPLM